MVRIVDTLTNVSVSVGRTSNSNNHRTSNGKLERKRAMPHAPAKPVTTPIIARSSPRFTTRFTTARRSAPRAIRMPSSCILWVTAYEMTVNSYGSQNQRQGSEGAEQPNDGLPLKYRARYDLFHRTDLRNRDTFVQSSNFSPSPVLPPLQPSPRIRQRERSALGTIESRITGPAMGA